MKTPFSNSFHEDPEARITALLLGELGAADAEALEAAIAANPELQALRRDLAQTIELLKQTLAKPQCDSAAAAPAPAAAGDSSEGSAQLSASRRAALQSAFKTVQLPPRRPHVEWRPPNLWSAALRTAAVVTLAVSLLLAAIFSLPIYKMSEIVAPRRGDSVRRMIVDTSYRGGTEANPAPAPPAGSGAGMGGRGGGVQSAGHGGFAGGIVQANGRPNLLTNIVLPAAETTSAATASSAPENDSLGYQNRELAQGVVRSRKTISDYEAPPAPEFAPLDLKLPIPAFMGTPTDVPVADAGVRTSARVEIRERVAGDADAENRTPVLGDEAKVGRLFLESKAENGVTAAGALALKAREVAVNQPASVPAEPALQPAPQALPPLAALGSLSAGLPAEGETVRRYGLVRDGTGSGAGLAKENAAPPLEALSRADSTRAGPGSGLSSTSLGVPLQSAGRARGMLSAGKPVETFSDDSEFGRLQVRNPDPSAAALDAARGEAEEGLKKMLSEEGRIAERWDIQRGLRSAAAANFGLRPGEKDQAKALGAQPDNLAAGYFYKLAESAQAAGEVRQQAESKLKLVSRLEELEDAEVGVRAVQGKDETPLTPVVVTGSKQVALDKTSAVAMKPMAAEELLEQRVAPPPTTPRPEPQPDTPTSENAFSTFSLNVSDVSFKLAGASLDNGQFPDPGSIRSEEFINALDYRDPLPMPGEPVAFAWERARYPFAVNRDVVRFSVKTAAAGRPADRPLNLVLCLDNSGSMERADRVQIIREALRVLATQLRAGDSVSVVTFARTARVWIDGLPGERAGELVEQVGNLTPQGGTNLGEALRAAYEAAARHYLAQGINRVVLLTDGAANLGDLEPESLKGIVEKNRRAGIAFDCFGIGWEGYNDELLETLSRNGDGRYGFVNTPEEAATEFVGQLAGALQVAASDVKVQVEFNPRRVTHFRQVGYAKHQLTKEQFRDNTVDAAEIGAAEAGNGIYVIGVDEAGQGPLATVRVRFRVPGTDNYQEMEWVVPFQGPAPALQQAASSLRLAAAASAFSEWLAGNPYAGDVTLDRLLEWLRGVPEQFSPDPRPTRLEWMIRKAKTVAGQ